MADAKHWPESKCSHCGIDMPTTGARICSEMGTFNCTARVPKALGASHADLIAALEAVVMKPCGCHSTTGEDWHAQSCVIPQAKAALKKARGEA